MSDLEQQKEAFESADTWRSAILRERESKIYSASLSKHLKDYSGKRDNALVLGDASLVQANWLLNKEQFQHLVDVDQSPTLLDDAIFEPNDTRLEKICTTFERYEPAEEFDLIFGKSIAFNPKASTPRLLQSLADHLSYDGIFFAEWGGEGDSYRHGIAHSKEELVALYESAGLSIIEMKEIDEEVPGLMNRPGRDHSFEILAKKAL